MERLTETNNCIRFMETYLNVDCKECQYKGTGECEKFKDECKAVADFKEFVKNMYSKLKDYEDLEEQGKLLKLHCSVGDMVYVISDDCDYGFGECHTKMLCENCEYRNLHIEGEIFSLSQIALRMNDFGKTVFLTRQEAEDKLAEMEGKK